MAEFLASGVDRSGKRKTERVIAMTSQEVVAEMSRRGYREIELHTDDAGAQVLRLKGIDDGVLVPADVVKMMELTKWGLFFHTMKLLIGKSKWMITLIAVLSVYHYYSNQQIGWSSIVPVLAAVGLLVGLSFWSAFLGASAEYDRFCEACGWGQWERVLELTPSLRGKVPDFELDAREAVALAGLGRYEEGVRRMAPHADSDECPKWMYHTRLAEVHAQAHRYDEALTQSRLALADAPDNPTVILEVAFALLKQGVETAEARRLIENAKSKPLGGLLKPLLPVLEGLLAIREERWRDAVGLLSDGREGLEKYAQHPLVRVVIDHIKAY